MQSRRYSDGDGGHDRFHYSDSDADSDCESNPNANHEGEDDGDQDEDDDDDATPIHPIPALQHAFEESIIEAAEDVQYDTTPTSATHPSAELRRRELLEQYTYDDSWYTRWNQQSTATCHPLTKLVAQIIFGMHLLANHQAKSDAEVVKILQAHVNDIDAFLEKATEDFDLAITDIEERRALLQLPMTHVDVFDIMLEDRTFRTQLVNGNEKIEGIIARSAKAMNASLFDVQEGINATRQLATYLDHIGPDWPRDYDELPAIYTAMRGNQQGWLNCFQDLQIKGNTLGVLLVQLGTTIADMSRLAAAASRRSMVRRHNQRKNVAPLTLRSTSLFLYLGPGTLTDGPNQRSQDSPSTGLITLCTNLSPKSLITSSRQSRPLCPSSVAIIHRLSSAPTSRAGPPRRHCINLLVTLDERPLYYNLGLPTFLPTRKPVSWQTLLNVLAHGTWVHLRQKNSTTLHTHTSQQSTNRPTPLDQTLQLHDVSRSDGIHLLVLAFSQTRSLLHQSRYRVLRVTGPRHQFPSPQLHQRIPLHSCQGIATSHSGESSIESLE